MKKVIIISKEVYYDLSTVERHDFANMLMKFVNSGNLICFVSRDLSELDGIKQKINFAYYRTRENVKAFLKENPNNKKYYTVLGNRDQDFYFAKNNQILLLVPRWTKCIYDKNLKYGQSVENFSHLNKIIDIINNQNNIYFEITLPDKTEVYSLISAKSYYAPQKEADVINGFHNTLKYNEKTYYELLKEHFLASATNELNLRDINYFSIIPSSTGSLDGPLMDFKENIRTTMGKKNPSSIQNKVFPNNLLLRNIPLKKKSHYYSREERENLGCTLHLGNLCLNPAFRGRLKNKNICVFDDYLTHGNSFEAARNLLRTQYTNRIVFISIGTYEYPYLFQQYKISGDVFSTDYTYNLLEKRLLYTGEKHFATKKEVENLHDIFLE